MRTSTKFVHGGGWVDRPRFGRPKLRLFATLAVGWCAVSAVPIWTVLSGAAGPEFSVVTVLCALCVVPEPVFIALAVFFYLREQPRPWTERVRNPDVDPHNCYCAAS